MLSDDEASMVYNRQWHCRHAIEEGSDRTGTCRATLDLCEIIIRLNDELETIGKSALIINGMKQQRE